MQKLMFSIYVIGCMGLCSLGILAQIEQKESQKTICSGETPRKVKTLDANLTDQEKLKIVKEESSFRSQIRYVIVYNELIDDLAALVRRVQIVIDEKYFTEKNLTEVINLLKERFPTPLDLTVEFHTNLATIETPEERDKATDGNRLDKEKSIYKTALYARFFNYREAFTYTTNIRPYTTKTVVLQKGN